MYIDYAILGTVLIFACLIYLVNRSPTFASHHEAGPSRNIRATPFALATTPVSGVSKVSGAVADPASDSGASQTGIYVKDSIITTKVKARLAAKHLSTLANIRVNADSHGGVWLSGKAPTQDASGLAMILARSTEGVFMVHNKIQVEQ